MIITLGETLSCRLDVELKPGVLLEGIQLRRAATQGLGILQEQWFPLKTDYFIRVLPLWPLIQSLR